VLEVTGIETWYGAIQALKGISLEVKQGEIVALLGSNGAGKSTTLKTITGLLRPSKGEISFLGQKITGRDPESIAELGIACVPEGRHIFPGLSVLDNLLLGTTPRKGATRAQIDEGLERVFNLFPVLKEFKNRLGWQLSGGQQQMLAIGRGLMSSARLMLLDEPSLGLAPVLVQVVFKVIAEINKSGTTVLLVEQNARMALLIANRGYVIETGRMTMADTASNLLCNEEMKAHYLGSNVRRAERRTPQPMESAPI
jgi:branched-chain amino acid transport system ATP-binding protein